MLMSSHNISVLRHNGEVSHSSFRDLLRLSLIVLISTLREFLLSAVTCCIELAFQSKQAKATVAKYALAITAA